MSIKKSWCPSCKAPLFEALTEDGHKVMLDWEPFGSQVTKAGIYIIIRGTTDHTTVKHFFLTDEWPEPVRNIWTAHSDTCTRSKK